ncbi:SDR family oxidoreductase [Nocardia tengchongensis]|uniref:SDR family oxidoreductase n=1 Tax=Nocardia tengchongensis TaxID=2055889 RepID=UPI0036C72B5D
MQVAVVGGTGTLGTPVVRELAARGHTVRVLSRSAPAEPVPGAEHHAVDLVTGAGLDSALEGVYAVVDAASHRGPRSAPVMVEGVRALLAAEQRAKVGHHVEISIVGCERVPFSYYRTKVAQERVVTQGPIPWTLVRATQFHELIDEVLGGVARLRIAPHGTMRFQPVEVTAVAGKLADAVEAGPSGRTRDGGGPGGQTPPARGGGGPPAARGGGGPGGPPRGAGGGAPPPPPPPRGLLPFPVPPIGRVVRRVRDGALCLGADGEAVSFDYAEWLRRRYTK